MHNEKPPFEITNEILDAITQIAELIGQVNATQGLSTNPTLDAPTEFAPYILHWPLSKTL